MKHLYFFLIFALSFSFVNAQNRVKVIGQTNGIEVQPLEILPTEASNIPNISDDTHFGTVPVGNVVIHSFDIENTTGSQFRIVDADVISTNEAFVIKLNPAGQIKPGVGEGSVLTVTFTAKDDFLSEAIITLRIQNGETYTFKVSGNTVESLGAVMISQYYNDGVSETVEIKNLSDIEIGAGLLSYSISGGAPTLINSIIPIGGTILVDASGANDNAFHLIRTTSSTVDEEILDIIGDNTLSWGSNTSFSKGGCATEEPHTTYDVNHWIELTIEEVDTAGAEQNISLGTYNLGPRIYDPLVYGGWSEGDFDRTRSVVINGDIPSQDYAPLFEMCDLTINAGFTFDYIDDDSPATIAVYRNLTIDGTFIVGDTESLIMKDGIVNYNGTFTKIENSEEKASEIDATYWSSPVEGAVLTTVFPSANPNRMFQIDPLNINSVYATYPKYEHWFNYTGTMENKGYSVEGDVGITNAEQIAEFTGEPNNGIIQVGVFIGDSSTDPLQDNRHSNLIGNPYPSAIDASSFIDGNGGGRITGTLYIWSQRTFFNGFEYQDGGYYTYNYSGGTGTGGGVSDDYKIASGQGFMVVANITTTVLFNNEMRFDRVTGEPITDNTQFYKSENSKKSDISSGERDRIWLRLTNQDNEVSEQLIGFFNQASDGVDYGYDGLSISDSDYNFYSVLENKKYTIQGLGDFATDKTVDLGFDIDKAGDFTVSISKIEGTLKDNDIFLVDNVLNITHDLKKGDYKFNQTDTGEFSNRFILQFAGMALDVDDEIFAKNEFVLSNDLDSFRIRSAKEVKDIKVYDLLGRMIIQKQPNKKSFNIDAVNIKNGTVLIIEATLENGSVISKKTIKY